MMGREMLTRRGLSDQLWPALADYLTDPNDIRSPLKSEALRQLPLQDWGERLRESAHLLLPVIPR